MPTILRQQITSPEVFLMGVALKMMGQQRILRVSDKKINSDANTIEYSLFSTWGKSSSGHFSNYGLNDYCKSANTFKNLCISALSQCCKSSVTYPLVKMWANWKFQKPSLGNAQVSQTQQKHLNKTENLPPKNLATLKLNSSLCKKLNSRVYSLVIHTWASQ